MIWRSIRLLSHLSGCTIPSRMWLRHSSSALRASNRSIATVLAIAPSAADNQVTAFGSVRTVRKQKHRAFVEVGDGSTVHTLQAILEPPQAEGYVLLHHAHSFASD